MKIVILNRWLDNFCDYEQLIDSSTDELIYITNKDGANYVQNYVSRKVIHYTVSDLRDYNSVKNILNEIITTNGKIDRIIAMSESDIAVAGKLRTEFKIAGMNEQISKNFTDKTAMKTALENTNIKFPKFGLLKNLHTNEIDFPLVLKPKNGNSSVGVYLVENEIELKKIIDQIDDSDNYEFEEFVSGPIYHVDGYMSNSKLGFCRACKYINTPYEYEHSHVPIGSILINDAKFINKIKNFTNNVLTNLGMHDGVFHLEFIDHNDQFVFLEVGSRQGGGEVVPMYKKVFNLDLIKIFFNTQLLLPISEKSEQLYDEAGFILFPVPQKSPCVVKKVSHFDKLTTLIYQITPDVNSILSPQGGYYFNSGRFLFAGNISDFKKDFEEVFNNFSITTEEVR